MELKRVVVTGMGALTPLGNTIEEYWNGLINGVSGADMITQFDASKFRTKFACEVKNFEPTQFLDRKEARKIDRFTQFALVVSTHHQGKLGKAVNLPGFFSVKKLSRFKVLYFAGKLCPEFRCIKLGDHIGTRDPVDQPIPVFFNSIS